MAEDGIRIKSLLLEAFFMHVVQTYAQDFLGIAWHKTNSRHMAEVSMGVSDTILRL